MLMVAAHVLTAHAAATWAALHVPRVAFTILEKQKKCASDERVFRKARKANKLKQMTYLFHASRLSTFATNFVRQCFFGIRRCGSGRCDIKSRLFELGVKS
jgi:hypothetical protein